MGSFQAGFGRDDLIKWRGRAILPIDPSGLPCILLRRRIEPAVSTANDLLIELRSVGKTFHMGEVEVRVLHNLSLKIYRREMMAIVGPSGSGKTTLLNLIGGLDQPTEGEVLFEERDLATFSPRELTRYRREHVGFVFQLYNLVPNLNAEENVALASELSNNPMDAGEALDLVGLSQRKSHFPSQLSGGEQQRVSIARAIAKRPELLLCDEPTGALDFVTGRQVMELLVDLNRRLETTIVVITHNQALAQVVDRSVHIRSGEVVESVKNDHPVKPSEVTW